MKEMSVGKVTVLLIFNLLFPFSSGNSDGVCVSKGGRFPPFSFEGQPPKKVTKGPKDLNLCRVFRKKTCCDIAQTYPALISIRKLGSIGEATQECLQLWELLECSICDPRIGVQSGPPLICASFCDRVFIACSNAYFSEDAKIQILAPCGVNDFLCGRLSEWVSNGTELCSAAGFVVKEDDKEAYCYGGRSSLDLISDSWKVSQPETPQRTGTYDSFADFQQWLKEMPFNERVSWAVGGMVLTAGIIFMSKRKRHMQRQKLAAIQRAAKKLEAQKHHKSFGSRGNRKASRG